MLYVQYTHIRWQCHSCWALRQFMQTSNSEVLFIAGCAVGQWPKFLESVPPDLNVSLYFSYFGALSGIWLPYHKLHEQKHGTRWGKEHGFLQTMNQKFCYNKIKKKQGGWDLAFHLVTVCYFVVDGCDKFDDQTWTKELDWRGHKV